MLAFGNILKGPDEETVKGVTNEALLPMLQLVQDESVIVQDSVAWMLGTQGGGDWIAIIGAGSWIALLWYSLTLSCLFLAGAICDSFPEIVSQPSVLPAVLSALDTGLSLEPRVANNACHVSHHSTTSPVCGAAGAAAH